MAELFSDRGSAAASSASVNLVETRFSHLAPERRSLARSTARGICSAAAATCPHIVPHKRHLHMMHGLSWSERATNFGQFPSLKSGNHYGAAAAAQQSLGRARGAVNWAVKQALFFGAPTPNLQVPHPRGANVIKSLLRQPKLLEIISGRGFPLPAQTLVHATFCQHFYFEVYVNKMSGN